MRKFNGFVVTLFSSVVFLLVRRWEKRNCTEQLAENQWQCLQLLKRQCCEQLLVLCDFCNKVWLLTHKMWYSEISSSVFLFNPFQHCYCLRGQYIQVHHVTSCWGIKYTNMLNKSCCQVWWLTSAPFFLFVCFCFSLGEIILVLHTGSSSGPCKAAV